MKNKYVVMTGGIGREIAKEFAKVNKNLVIIARNKERLISLKEEILNFNKSIDIKIYDLDLSIMDNVYNFYKSLDNIDIEVL